MLLKFDLCGAVRKEMQIMGCLVHPHIIRLYELIETGQRWYAVMEYAEVGAALLVFNVRVRSETGAVSWGTRS